MVVAGKKWGPNAVGKAEKYPIEVCFKSRILQFLAEIKK